MFVKLIKRLFNEEWGIVPYVVFFFPYWAMIYIIAGAINQCGR